MRLPALVEFTEAIPEIGVEKGDQAWVTHDSAVLVKSVTFAFIRPHLHLTRPVTLGGGLQSLDQGAHSDHRVAS